MSTLAEALAPKSDQLNADDLIAGTRVLKITGARIAKDGRETRIILNFEGDQGKPWKPCKTMGRAMVMAWAITDEAQFVGKSVQVYRDPDRQVRRSGRSRRHPCQPHVAHRQAGEHQADGIAGQEGHVHLPPARYRRSWH
jgi:hypothetical protein